MKAMLTVKQHRSVENFGKEAGCGVLGASQ